MKIQTKVLWSISLGMMIFLIIHFFLVIVYVSPLSWKNQALDFRSKAYVDPIFRQGWRLFSPVPSENAKLFFQYKSEGVWSEEISFEEELSDLKVWGTDRMSLKLAYYLANDVRELTIVDNDGPKDYDLVKSTIFYARCWYACARHLDQTREYKTDSIRLILERERFPLPGFTETETIRDYFKPDGTKLY